MFSRKDFFQKDCADALWNKNVAKIVILL